MLNAGLRRERILQTLDAQEKVRVKHLAQRLGVSAGTIRGDLEALATAGLLLRQHGGASPTQRTPRPARALRHDRKQRIADCAADLVQPGDKLILDAGASTLQLALNLARSLAQPSTAPRLTVFTSSLPIANELASVPDMELILSGGVLRTDSQSFQGPRAEASMDAYVFDKLFLAAAGFDPEFGLSTHDDAEARLNQRMVAHAREVIVLADAKTLGQTCLHRICALSRISTVVTDAGIAPALQAALERQKVRVLIAKEN
ncbi:DeoR/GlpR family DNA-binding transcription regulator [Massilia terrae]|uniref:DeoR/GlpR family DNA-binding transcription regulator n=1 Tax=Massilia terrae TaxID=1811224 RepID=A0ABT2CT69_9BURK|nr:DeoR/GlpR family DNA-binding transcription regulator [Massilia terrae]